MQDLRTLPSWEVIAIKASQKDSILEVGFLKTRASNEPRSKYMIRFLDEDDLQEVIKLQEIVLNNLNDPELYHPSSIELLQEYLGRERSAIGVEIDEGIVGFSCIRMPGENEQNLGRDIRMSREDLKRAANIQFTFVHPDYRGNAFQMKLIKHILDIIKDLGYCHALCTVSPKNYHSLRNMFQNGLLIKEITTKYGGLLRYILYKNMNINSNPTWQDVITIESSDIYGQKKLLNEGYLGFNASKISNEILILYGRIMSESKVIESFQ